MGGELIIQILKESKVMNNLDELVLSPHRRVDLVRSYLLEKGWSIVEETMVKDMDKYYTIMKVIPVSESVAYSKSEMIYGRILLNDRNEILKEYLDKEYHKFMNILTTMKENGNTNTEEIEQKIKLIREAVGKYASCKC
jgi:tRNA (adenine22-N1)-methyltransferase